MSLINKTVVGALMGASVMAFSAVSASAAIVCRGPVCWHTHDAYDYPAGARVIVHPDDWAWGPHEHFAWREHEGRGYWSGHQWKEW
jgi:hypothetical protein